MRSPAKFEKLAGQFHSSREAWAKVEPNAFASGSMQQAVNVLHCAVDDIERLHQERAELLDALQAIATVSINEIADYSALATRMQKQALAAIAKAEGH